jgi:hypothetical protein
VEDFPESFSFEGVLGCRLVVNADSESFDGIGNCGDQID